MVEFQHRSVPANGIRLHVVEAGPADGPAVLLVHGFPESWYSWRHQLAPLAEAGFRAIALDVRGYGRSSQPAAVDAYRMTCHVGDNVALLASLGISQAAIVGHDWGAPIAWHSALVRPDLFTALGLLSVPYTPRGAHRPTSRFRLMGGAEEFYIEYFQQPGRAEAEIEPDVAGWLLGFYVSASGDGPPLVPGNGSMATIPAGGRMRDRFRYPPEGTFPTWLSAEDHAFYTAEFERTGLTGGLNRYRNVDRDWEDFAAYADRPITVPSLFIGGDRDGPTLWGAAAIERFGETLPGLRSKTILPGCGHWTQQERPDDVNRLLLEFLRGLDR